MTRNPHLPITIKPVDPDNLGFDCKKQAAEFILANENWNELVKVDFDKRDFQVVNV